MGENEDISHHRRELHLLSNTKASFLKLTLARWQLLLYVQVCQLLEALCSMVSSLNFAISRK
jgi:hypothetical protein